MDFNIAKVTKEFTNGKAIHFPDIQLVVGEPIGLYGRSGSGKSTLLRILAGLDTQYQGQYVLFNQAINNLTAKQIDSWRSQHIGVVFQKMYFVKSLTALENLKIVFHHRPMSFPAEWCLQLCQELKVHDKLNQMPDSLSAGEQQRFTIIRALLQKPKLLLADEPTSGLDDENSLKIVQLLKKYAVENQSLLLIATHDALVKQNLERSINL